MLIAEERSGDTKAKEMKLFCHENHGPTKEQSTCDGEGVQERRIPWLLIKKNGSGGSYNPSSSQCVGESWISVRTDPGTSTSNYSALAVRNNKCVCLSRNSGS